MSVWIRSRRDTGLAPRAGGSTAGRGGAVEWARGDAGLVVGLGPLSRPAFGRSSCALLPCACASRGLLVVLASASLGEDAALLDLLVEATQGAFERLVLTHSDFCQSRFTSPAWVSLVRRRARGQPALTLPRTAIPSRGWRSIAERPEAGQTWSSGRTTYPIASYDGTHPRRSPGTLLDLLDDAVTAIGDKTRSGLAARRRLDRDLDVSRARPAQPHRRLAPARARLEPGDRILTWSPVDPGAAGRLFRGDAGAARPRPARPADGARRDRAASSARPSAKRLLLGTGRDAPDPREAGLDRFPTTRRRRRSPPSPDDVVPARLGGAGRRLAERPRPDDDLRARLHLGHDRDAEGRDARPRQRARLGASRSTAIIPPMEHRIVSLLPLSHLLEQAVGLFYALDVGADILYVRSRNPRVIFDALRDHRVTSMVVVPQVLDLFWSAIEREVEKRGRTRDVRPAARHRPAPAVRGCGGVLFRQRPRAARRRLPAVRQRRRVPAAGAPAGVGGPRRHRPPGLRRDRDRRRDVHDARRPRPRDGGPAAAAGIEMRIADDGEIQFRGPTVVQGLLGRPRRPRPRRSPTTAGTGPATSASSTTAGRLDPDGPDEGHHRPAQRLQRVSRGHRERAADRRHPRLGRARDEARPDRGGRPAAGRRRRRDARAAIRGLASTPRSRPPTRRSARTSGSPGWRLWPEEDFPRTHTLKVKRDVVRRWAAVDEPLPVREGA